MCVCVCYSSRLDAQRPERQRDKFRAKPREGCVFFVCFGYLLMNPHNSQVICMWGCQCKCNADRAHKTYTHMYVYIYCTGGVTGKVVVFCHVCTSRHARARTEKHKTGSYDRFSIQRGKIPLTSAPAQASEREAKDPVVLIHSMWRGAVPLKHWRMQIDASIILKCISSNSVKYARMF